MLKLLILCAAQIGRVDVCPRFAHFPVKKQNLVIGEIRIVMLKSKKRGRNTLL
jgi:hypothetical protein